MVGQFDVVPGKWRRRPHQGFQRLALEAHLPRRFGIGCGGLIHIGEVEIGVAVAARADLDDRLRIGGLGGLVNRLPEGLQALDRLFGARVVVGRIVARRDAVEVLAVDLDAFEAPILENARHQLFGVGDGRLIGRAQIERVPPRDQLWRAVLVEQQHVRMIVQQIGAGIDGQRRHPQARLQAGGLDGDGQVAHVGIATRELLRIEIPVAFGGLPAVVEHRPFQAQLGRLGQGALNLFGRAGPVVAPGAPDAFVGTGRRGRGGQTAFGQDLAICGERREIVACVRRHECVERGEAVAGFQRHSLVHGHGYGRAGGCGDDRQRYQLGRRLDMADGDAGIWTPDVDDGRAAAVVRRVHAHEVGLAETGLDRLYPVAAILVRRSRPRPEAAAAVFQQVRAIAPAGDIDRRCTRVVIGDLLDRETGLVGVEGQADGLFQALR